MKTTATEWDKLFHSYSNHNADIFSDLNGVSVSPPQRRTRVEEKAERDMPEGTIKRLTDKGFGFIDDGSGKDMFFHSSNVEGTSYDDLQEGQKVSYEVGQGPKGPRAENVRVV